MAFDIDFSKKAEIKLHVKKFLLYPKHWDNPTFKVNQNLKWSSYKFTKANRSKIPLRKGIYCFVLKPKVSNFFVTNYLFYVGKTTRTLNIRYKEYLNDWEGKGKPRHRIFEMLNMYEGHLYFYYTELNSNNVISDIEDKFIDTFVPFVNTQVPQAKIKPEYKDVYN